ncbi:uncharacterized protein LOC118348789 [Juglans regia]|uniref:Uncharacterized protein LOC118348789 n=1 Tax=Juglans regia TaxID=51240 RepID=A0A6P9ETJ5_JUGRE|nr:uncharacterized protein LOC118348789 [Juglans regia]
MLMSLLPQPPLICSLATIRLHTPQHPILQLSIYWDEEESRQKAQHVALRRGLFPCVFLTCRRATTLLTTIRVVPAGLSHRDLPDLSHPVSIPSARGCHALSQEHGNTDDQQISPPDVGFLTMLSLFLNHDLEEGIADLSKNHLKTTSNSTPATLTAFSKGFTATSSGSIVCNFL